MALKKRTIKFLKNAKKGANSNTKTAGKGGNKGSSSSNGGNKNKKPRMRKEDMLEDMEVERVVPLRKHLDGTISAAIEGNERKKKHAVGPSSIGKHRNELQSLSSQDPEFFKYLQENDANLLEFGEGEEDDEEEEEDDDSDLEGEEFSDDDDDEEEEEEEEGSITKSSSSSRHIPQIMVVTEEILNETIEKAKGGSFVALKKLLAIFRSACLPSGKDETADDEEDDRTGMSSFSIPSPEVYQQVIVGVTDHAHVCMYLQLDLDELTPDHLSKLKSHPKWKKLQFLVLSFFKSMLHVLAGVSIASQQEQVTSFLVGTLEAYLPLLTPLPRLSKAVLNTLLTLWATGPSPSENKSGSDVRVQAFLRVRQMALMLPGTVREECFRSIYLRFARAAKSCTEMNIGSVSFMAQSIAELYQSDPVQAYQQAFLYIRQLALHLRTAMAKQTSEATRQVTTWQFMHCIRLWTRVVCSMPREDQLGPLVFPLTQVMFGVMAAAPSIYLVPLRLHLITCLQQLAAYGKVFIPTAARLMEILEHADLVAPPVPSTEAPPKLSYMVRLPDEALLKVATRDAVVAEVATLLRHDAEIYRYHVGYPEYAYLTVRKLRAFGKKTKIPKWRDITRTLAGQMDDYAAFAKQARVKLGKAPMQIKDFEPLLSMANTTITTSSSSSFQSKSGSQAAGAATTSVHPPSAAQRLVKLLADRSLSIPKEIVISTNHHATATGLTGGGAAGVQGKGGKDKDKSSMVANKQTGKRNRDEEEEDEDEEEDEEEDDDKEEEDDEEEEEEEEGEEEEGEEDNDNDGDEEEDKIGALDWSDDES